MKTAWNIIGWPIATVGALLAAIGLTLMWFGSSLIDD